MTLRRLFGLVDLPRSGMALAIGLGVLAAAFGVALMGTAGYLISRAAEQPPILALTTIVVVIRFLALARPLARYLERLASHDLALRGLGRVRARVYERIEPLAPGELDAFRRGDLVQRMVGDVDALQSLFVRGVGPPVVALLEEGEEPVVVDAHHLFRFARCSVRARADGQRLTRRFLPFRRRTACDTRHAESGEGGH